MDPIDTLSTISEITITLAGFAAIATSLQTKSAGLLAATRIRLRFLLLNSFGILFISLLGILLLHLELSARVVWGCTSVLFLSAFAGNAWWAREYQPVLKSTELELPRLFNSAFIILMISAVAANIANLVFWGNFGPLLYGIVSLLFGISGSFTWLVVTYLDDLVPEGSQDG